MADGLFVKSSYGALFLSSEIRYPHFMVKLTSSNLVGSAVNFTSYSGSTRYNFAMTEVIPSDLLFQVFIKPNAPGEYHALLGSVINTSGKWEFDVICGGSGTAAPDLYIFVEIHDTPAAIWDETEAGYGIRMNREDGEISLDTRFKPLALENSKVSVYPKSVPSDGGTSIPGVVLTSYTTSESVVKGQATYDFSSDNSSNTFLRSDPRGDMFAFDSVPQAGMIQQSSYYDCDCGFWLVYDWTGDDIYEVYAKYGVYYRAGIKLTATSIECGWIPIRDDVAMTSSVTEKGAIFSSSGYTQVVVSTDLPMENAIVGYTSTTPMIASSSDYD